MAILKLALISVAVAVFGTLVSNEIRAWLPWFAVRLKNRAVGRLPHAHRSRYDEEWAAGLEEIPGDLSKLFYALSLSRGASKISLLDPEKKPRSNRKLSLLRRQLDIAAAVTLLVVCLPLLLCVAVLLRLGSSGPILFKQRRVGRKGHEFTLYRFRTMIRENNLANPRNQFFRISPVGAFLRRYQIDELPQLWNVLRGDMTLIELVPPLGPDDKFRP